MKNELFYNTLFDENASCHLALGKSFSECLKIVYQWLQETIIGKRESMIL